MTQPGILLPLPAAGRHLVADLADASAAPDLLAGLGDLPVGDGLVVGLGAPLLSAVGATVPGLRGFPAMTGPGIAVPSTQGALWAWVRASDPGGAWHGARALRERLGPAVVWTEDLGCFVHDGGRDLSGYADGTENPQGDEAALHAIVSGRGPGLDGGSFVAVQRWVHDLDRMAALRGKAMDDIVGRERESDEELDDAPETAHVKRTAQGDRSAKPGGAGSPRVRRTGHDRRTSTQPCCRAPRGPACRPRA